MSRARGLKILNKPNLSLNSSRFSSLKSNKPNRVEPSNSSSILQARIEPEPNSSQDNILSSRAETDRVRIHSARLHPYSQQPNTCTVSANQNHEKENLSGSRDESENDLQKASNCACKSLLESCDSPASFDVL